MISRSKIANGDTLTFTWDHRNRLTEIAESWSGVTSGPTFDLKYDYDLFDRRVSRSLTTSPDGGEGNGSAVTTTVEKYVYDGDGASGGDNVVFDFLKPDGGSFSLEHRYLYGPAIDQVLAQENVAQDISAAGRVFWMLVDNEGTVRDLVDNSGKVAQHYTYDAFGGMLSGDQTLTRYFYTGREFDAATGLQYNRERWYDPHSGRWLTQDPIGRLNWQNGTTLGSNGDNPALVHTEFADGSNPFIYVHNSPTNATDPSGLDRQVMVELGHVYILVDGNIKLDFNLTGYHVTKTDIPPGVCVTTRTSTPAQDQELIQLWKKMQKDRQNSWIMWILTSWNIPVNCITVSWGFIDWGLTGNIITDPDGGVMPAK
ncbi:MAG: RHS repeat-associated core domain-containing protein [Planctomycetia bacterium]|nr:RHS repeat-associated core domain-containing protein [Planctomycetia bacterium]